VRDGEGREEKEERREERERGRVTCGLKGDER
jgi:hypothetical protein